VQIIFHVRPPRHSSWFPLYNVRQIKPVLVCSAMYARVEIVVVVDGSFEFGYHHLLVYIVPSGSMASATDWSGFIPRSCRRRSTCSQPFVWILTPDVGHRTIRALPPPYTVLSVISIPCSGLSLYLWRVKERRVGLAHWQL
jgi:hypothetical protein